MRTCTSDAFVLWLSSDRLRVLVRSKDRKTRSDTPSSLRSCSGRGVDQHKRTCDGEWISTTLVCLPAARRRWRLRGSGLRSAVGLPAENFRHSHDLKQDLPEINISESDVLDWFQKHVEACRNLLEVSSGPRTISEDSQGAQVAEILAGKPTARAPPPVQHGAPESCLRAEGAMRKRAGTRGFGSRASGSSVERERADTDLPRFQRRWAVHPIQSCRDSSRGLTDQIVLAALGVPML